ncbi:MAG: hypothetical protein M3Z25_01510 [Actinomycetota bacterium]|nr:hypothetical protein [Actinomycetota bacterium]
MLGFQIVERMFDDHGDYQVVDRRTRPVVRKHPTTITRLAADFVLYFEYDR